MRSTLDTRLFTGSRGRILQMLRAGGMTVDDLATQLGLSPNAVRVQMTGLERDGLVRHTSERRTTRPSHVFQLTREAQQSLSNAYIPFLNHLVAALAERQPPAVIAKLMRDTGSSLAATLRGRAVSTGPLAARAEAASVILNEELGAATRVDARNRHFVIRGHGCPLAALTGGQPTVCLALETLLAELTGTRVRECCNREDPPRCCFEISAARPRAKARSRPGGRRGR